MQLTWEAALFRAEEGFHPSPIYQTEYSNDSNACICYDSFGIPFVEFLTQFELFM